MAGEILRFPTARKAAYRNPASWWENPLPENVRRLRERARPEPHFEALRPSEYLLLALIEALREDATKSGEGYGPDVIGALQRMHERWEDDPEVSVRVGAAIRLLFARKSGRWGG